METKRITDKDTYTFSFHPRENTHITESRLWILIWRGKFAKELQINIARDPLLQNTQYQRKHPSFPQGQSAVFSALGLPQKLGLHMLTCCRHTFIVTSELTDQFKAHLKTKTEANWDPIRFIKKKTH